jgi:stalled ribosome alternative rescue factor ArfA
VPLVLKQHIDKNPCKHSTKYRGIDKKNSTFSEKKKKKKSRKITAQLKRKLFRMKLEKQR